MTKASRRLKKLLRQNKRNEEYVLYEKTVRYNLMEDTVSEYRCSHNDLYCGYGRQPITQEENKEIGGLEITVYCTFDNHKCVRHWQKGDKHFDNRYCLTYRKYILGEGNDNRMH